MYNQVINVSKNSLYSFKIKDTIYLNNLKNVVWDDIKEWLYSQRNLLCTKELLSFWDVKVKFNKPDEWSSFFKISYAC